ncbi:MAG: hypothetical protein H6642_08470 [Caldilineaceae bacterium]|nr:hypothetical protein [Caldilineaceae bacterium]
MPDTRVSLRRLAIPLLLSVILPVSGALLLDLNLGTLPVATIVAVVICMPFGAFWLNRVSLAELDRVIAEVAPAEPPEDEASVTDAGEEHA